MAGGAELAVSGGAELMNAEEFVSPAFWPQPAKATIARTERANVKKMVFMGISTSCDFKYYWVLGLKLYPVAMVGGLILSGLSHFTWPSAKA